MTIIVLGVLGVILLITGCVVAYQICKNKRMIERRRLRLIRPHNEKIETNEIIQIKEQKIKATIEMTDSCLSEEIS